MTDQIWITLLWTAVGIFWIAALISIVWKPNTENPTAEDDIGCAFLTGMGVVVLLLLAIALGVWLIIHLNIKVV